MTTTTYATTRGSKPDSSPIASSMRIGGIDFERQGDELVATARDPRLGLGLDESTSFSQKIGGALGEYLRGTLFGQRRPDDPTAMHGAWATSFPALRCALALGPEGKETVTLSGYLEPDPSDKTVALSNPTGEMFPGLEHKNPTTEDLLKVERGPARLLEAKLLAKISIRGEEPGELEAPITVLDRSSAPSTNSAIEALEDLTGHYVKIARGSLIEHNEALAEKRDPTAYASSLSGMVKSVSDKGVVTIIGVKGQETEIKPERQIIYQVDHVRIPACWDWRERQGQHSEMLNENKYISDRFKRGAPIEVSFSERTLGVKRVLGPSSNQKIEGHFWQTIDDKKHGLLVVMRDKAGEFIAIPLHDIRRMSTTNIGKSTSWDDGYEVRTVPEKERSSSGIQFSLGSRSAREIPCSAEWGHTFFGKSGWIAPESIG